MSNTRTILFYRQDDPYGEFSNFSAHPFKLNGRVWPTSEHYFQAQKFAGTEHEETVRNAKTPSMAAKLGRSRSLPLRADWETVKDDVMRAALRAKFEQHPKLKSLLLSTGDAELIEHTRNDSYWADGGDGTGKNRLGILLMELRAELILKTEPTANPTTR
ncbi:MAG: NADAR family protein [Verrucomicrobiota bacterium]|mgnify:FL=1